MRGLPCLRDTRVTVSAVLGQLAAGRTIHQVLEDYPYLEVEDILAALSFAAEAMQERELPLAQPPWGCSSTRTSRRGLPPGFARRGTTSPTSATRACSPSMTCRSWPTH